MPSCETCDRARSAGTRPRTDRTLEINLTAVRDLARYLASRPSAVTGWQLAAAGDVEAFLATIASPANRARQLHALHVFFRCARSHRIILADPARAPAAQLEHPLPRPAAAASRTAPATAPVDRRRGNAAPARTRSRPARPAARRLRRRTAPAAHRRHRPARATIRLGRRPRPVPLDPATTTALRRCLDHHDRHHRGGNPHLLVSQKSKTTAEPVSASYLKKLLAPAGVTPAAAGHQARAPGHHPRPASSSPKPSASAAAPSCTTSPTPSTPSRSPTREHQAPPCIPSANLALR